MWKRTRFCRLTFLGVCAVLAGTADKSAQAADPQPYKIVFPATGSSPIDEALRASAQLVTLNSKAPVPPFALIERAKDDIPRLQTALDSFGYYQNNVTITIADRDLADADLPVVLDAVPQGTAVTVKVSVTMGPLYRLGNITIEGLLLESARAALGIKSGDPALAGAVLDAQTRLVSALQEDGYALAKVDSPVATANDAAHLIDVVYKVAAGPQIDIGAIDFKGLKDVNESFARRALTVKSGERYRPSRIEAARQSLAGLGVFSGVSVHAADSLSADGRIPLTFDVQERKPHAVTLAGTYSTDLGISFSTTWSHRNLFGNAEQLNLTVAGTGLGNATAGLGYNLSARYIQPMFLEINQTLEFDLSGIKQQLDAYDQRAETIGVFVRRKFSPLWSAGAGLTLTHDDITQEGTKRLYQLLALPLTGSYDSTGVIDGLRDPTTGLRASLALTPTHAFGAANLNFLPVQISASSYFDIGGDGRSVIALRALAASILGGSHLELPPDQRLYVGGSATVRGFAYQSIGPQFADGKPIGAKSVDAGTIEFRQRIGEDWGAVAFFDAGQAGKGGTPFSGTPRVGAGVGARYYTPIGAVRLDVAVPLTRMPRGDAFELYIGLGQAF